MGDNTIKRVPGPGCTPAPAEPAAQEPTQTPAPELEEKA